MLDAAGKRGCTNFLKSGLGNTVDLHNVGSVRSPLTTM